MQIYTWKLRKADESDAFAEFDGLEIDAPSDADARAIVAGLAGEHGIPEDGQYLIERTGKAYEFRGGTDEWYKAMRDGDAI